MRHVIIGAGQAGISAADILRQEGGPDHEIVVLGAEADDPYDHPPLSKGYLRGEEDVDAVRLREPGWYAENGITCAANAPCASPRTATWWSWRAAASWSSTAP